MPAFPNLADAEVRDLIAFLRTLQPRNGGAAERAQVTLTTGASLEGLVLNSGTSDLQLLGGDRKIHLLRRSGSRYRPVTSQADWPSYNGETSGYRYSRLAQIDKGNVARVAPRWMFTLPNTAPLQVTPVVVEGVMYVTARTSATRSMPARAGEIWDYQRPRTAGSDRQRGRRHQQGRRRGGRPGVHGDRQRSSDCAQPLHRRAPVGSGDGRLAPELQRHRRAVAGRQPRRGRNIRRRRRGARFLAAFDQATGKEVWRFWTVPAPGEPGSETWQGPGIAHPGATTWLTGTYDPELDTLYWPTGNPTPDLYGDDRPGDNLYSDSILALDAEDRAN